MRNVPSMFFEIPSEIPDKIRPLNFRRSPEFKKDSHNDTSESLKSIFPGPDGPFRREIAFAGETRKIPNIINVSGENLSDFQSCAHEAIGKLTIYNSRGAPDRCKFPTVSYAPDLRRKFRKWGFGQNRDPWARVFLYKYLEIRATSTYRAKELSYERCLNKDAQIYKLVGIRKRLPSISDRCNYFRKPI